MVNSLVVQVQTSVQLLAHWIAHSPSSKNVARCTQHSIKMTKLSLLGFLLTDQVDP